MLRPIRAVGDHGVKGVGHRNDARHHRDGRALQLVGVSGAVPALVVMPDSRGQHRRRTKWAGDLGAQNRVFLDLGKLLRRVGPLLVQQFLRQADLPDVV